MIRVLEEDLNSKMGENDRLFLYFSGHGSTIQVHRKQAGFLLTYDSVVYDWPTRKRPFMKRPPARALDMRTLMARVELLAPRHKMISVDACFSGYAARSKDINAVGITPRRLERWLSEPVIQILTAGRAGQKAIEKGSYGHGVFTWHLLKGLAGNADEAGGGPDGLLRFDELAAFVRNRVSGEPGVDQDPQAGQIGEGQFVFRLGGENVKGEARRLAEEERRLKERIASADKQREAKGRLRRQRERIAAFNRQAEEAERRLRKERERPKVAVGPGTPQQIGSGLDAMVKVPAGWFIMGSNSGQKDEKPRRRVYLDEFYIDKYPVTNAAYMKFVRATSSNQPEWMESGSKYNVETETDDDYKKLGSSLKALNNPVVGVRWRNANAYCGWARKRLPTEAEWEKTARGVNGRKYPWGGQWDPTKVIWSKNSGGKTHPVDRTYNTHRSPYGAVDMSGNVWEWVGDWFNADYYRNAPARNPKGPATGTRRVVRGGSWDYDMPTNFRAANRTWYLPASWLSLLGFRCAKAP